MNGSVDKYRVATRHPKTGKYDRWRIRFDLAPDAYTGKRKRGTQAGFTSRAEADDALAEVLGEVHGGTYVKPSQQRLGVYLTGWLAGISVKPTTRDNYRTAAEVHTIPRLGGVPLKDLTAEQVDGLYRQLEQHGKAVGKCRTAGVTCKANDCSPARHDGMAPKSVRHVHTMLRKALQDAVGRGYLGRNVADLANPPTQRSARGRRARDQAWNRDTLRAFIAGASGDRLWPMWQLLIATGLRRAEVCGLRWQDVDLERGRLRVAQTITEVRGELVVQDTGKTDAAERTMALDRRTVETLRRWKVDQAAERLAWPGDWPDTGLVFTMTNGEGHRPKRVSSKFTLAVDALGLPRIGVHGLRHTSATASLRAGVSPEVVSQRLGHASVVITLGNYAHVFEQDDQAAAELTAEAIFGP